MLSNAARAGAGTVGVVQADNDNASALRRL
jgi:hypothetical protein